MGRETRPCGGFLSREWGRPWTAPFFCAHALRIGIRSRGRSALHSAFRKGKIEKFGSVWNSVPQIMILRCLVVTLALMCSLHGHAAEKALRVAVLNHSPPMSYTDAAGVLTGFNVEIMYALCEAMGVKCEPVPVTLERVVDVVAAGEFDFAAVSLLSTPERRARVLMSKPYYRSISVWFARPGVVPGGVSSAVVRGGVQARYVQAQGWKSLLLDSHGEVVTALLRGHAEAALLPMATAVALQQDSRIHPLGLTTTLLRDPQLAGDVCLSVNPRTPELLARLNEAIDRIKRDGRFDRINSRFIPFRLQ